MSGDPPDPVRRAHELGLATLTSGEVRVTATDQDDRAWLARKRPLLVWGPSYARDPAALTQAAGWGELPEQVVAHLADAQLPLPLELANDPQDAEQRLARWGARTGLTLRVSEPPSWGRAMCAVLLFTFGASFSLLGTLAFVGMLAWVGAVVVALVILGTGAASLLVSMVLAASWLLARRHHERAVEAWRFIAATRAAWEGDEALLQAHHLLSAARRELTHLDLPEAAAMDIRGALREVEDRLSNRSRGMDAKASERARAHLQEVCKLLEDHAELRSGHELRGALDRLGEQTRLAMDGLEEAAPTSRPQGTYEGGP